MQFNCYPWCQIKHSKVLNVFRFCDIHFSRYCDYITGFHYYISQSFSLRRKIRDWNWEKKSDTKDKVWFSGTHTILCLDEPQINLFLYCWNPADKIECQRFISLCSSLLSSTVNMRAYERHEKGELWKVEREGWCGWRLNSSLTLQ